MIGPRARVGLGGSPGSGAGRPLTTLSLVAGALLTNDTSLPASVLAGDLLIHGKAATIANNTTYAAPWVRDQLVDDTGGSPCSNIIGHAIAAVGSGLTTQLAGNGRFPRYQFRGGNVVGSVSNGAAAGTALVIPALAQTVAGSWFVGCISARVGQTDLTFLVPAGFTQRAEQTTGPACVIFDTAGAATGSFAGASGTFDTETTGWGCWLLEVAPRVG